MVLDSTLLLEDFSNLYSVPNKNGGTLFCYKLMNYENWRAFSEELVSNLLGLKLFVPSLKKRIKLLPTFMGVNTTFLSV